MPETDRTTIVIITHDYGRFLATAIQSAAEQTVRPRVLIMDDGSTDSQTEDVIRAARVRWPWLVSHRSRAALGLSATRNAAAARVETEWIVYLDADDWLDTRFVERGERWLDRHPGLDVLTTDMTVVRAGRRPFVAKAMVPRSWPGLLRRNSIVQTSFIRRAMVGALGGYDTALEFEDWDFWIRALKAGYRVGRLPGAHVYRREHGLNKSKRCDEALATQAVRDRHPVA
jgi:glycosyltransferase involved in cell wall biosynthesis